MGNKLIVTAAPHMHAHQSTARIMWGVSLALLPAGAAGVYLFGYAALAVIGTAVAAALATEWLLQKMTRRQVTLLDGSAFLTGLLLAYNLPSGVPLWMPAVGSFFAIAVGKQIFGGLGQNIFNPALAARAFLMASWPAYMTSFRAPGFDAVASATPLSALKEGHLRQVYSYLDLFLGNKGGCIGEVCVVGLLAGAVFLFLKGYITWHIPVSYLFTTGILHYVFGPSGLFSGDWLFYLLSGGLVLGAFYMATDYVTSPLTAQGQLIYGTGCGLLTAVIRLWGGYPEGTCYAILMMNAVSPFIDRYTRGRIYGTGKMR